MKITCRSNLDLHYSEKWPDELPCRPMVGDLIRSDSNWGTKEHPCYLELKVIRVTFQRQNDYIRKNKDLCSIRTWKCIVELHLPPHRFDNITRFTEWYDGRWTSSST